MLQLLVGLCSVAAVHAGSGGITNWGGDPTGQACGSNVYKCDNGEWECSASMRNDCTCAYGQVAGKDTAQNSYFRQMCQTQGSLYGATQAELDACYNCELPVCDGPYTENGAQFPVCSMSGHCENKICINGYIETYEMDACPSNHQQNVAKCCLFGNRTNGAQFCACVTPPDGWLDVNQKTMTQLGCGGTCTGGQSWTPGPCNTSTPCGSSCSDVSPDGNSCAQQAAWGKCGESWMDGFCCATCANSGICGGGGGGATTTTSGGGGGGGSCGSSCDNVPPDGQYTCEQQAAWGKCGESWMQGYCCRSCANQASCASQGCGSSCSNVPPDDSYTCEQQASWGKCSESWMQGYCCSSCANNGICSGK